MRTLIYIIIPLFCLVSCQENKKENFEQEEEQHAEELTQIHISAFQAEALEIQTDTLKKRNLGASIAVNGELKVPPQNQAIITSVFGANISEIKVGEGEKINKNQVLAYLSHPDLINLQIEYSQMKNELSYLKREFKRQEKLYKEGVASGMIFQEAEKKYSSARQQTKGLEAKLHLLNLNPKAIENGEIYQQIPVVSPIDGFMQQINVRTGQFVEPQTAIFELVNPKDIYAELKVYEKEASQISAGQEVKLKILSSIDEEINAVVYSVGKAFNSDSKAIKVLAKLENQDQKLFPGTFVKAKIKKDKNSVIALPESAIVDVEDKNYAFIGIKNQAGDWEFSAEEVKINQSDEGWIPVTFFREIPKNTLFAYNHAYYLLAEAQKGLGGHDH